MTFQRTSPSHSHLPKTCYQNVYHCLGIFSRDQCEMLHVFSHQNVCDRLVLAAKSSQRTLNEAHQWARIHRRHSEWTRTRWRQVINPDVDRCWLFIPQFNRRRSSIFILKIISTDAAYDIRPTCGGYGVCAPFLKPPRLSYSIFENLNEMLNEIFISKIIRQNESDEHSMRLQMVSCCLSFRFKLLGRGRVLLFLLLMSGYLLLWLLLLHFVVINDLNVAWWILN